MRRHRFAIALTIYAAALLLLILAGLFLFWHYIAAYELSLVDGVMDDYLADGLAEDINRDIDRFASAHETVFESAGDIAGFLRSAVESDELTWRKSLQDYTPEEPVYSIRLGKQELGRVYFRSYSGGALDFGFSRWFVHRTELDLDVFSREYTVLAPSEAPVTLNGELMTAANCSVSWEEPAELLPYSGELSEMPLYGLYTFSAISPVQISLSSGEGKYLLSQDENSFSVTQICPPELSDQLHKYTEDFVRAYIAFTSNSTGPAAVTGYMIRGGTLYQRMYAAMDGLSWVRGVTGRISELSTDSLQYYGCAATLQAHYVLTADGRDTDNNMKIVLTQTDLGWRVAEAELF